MLDVKEAVRIALEYVSDLFKAERARNIGLEEVVFDEDARAWDVTVGFSRPWDLQNGGALSTITGNRAARQYKVVRVDAASGRVKSVKIRQPEAAGA